MSKYSERKRKLVEKYNTNVPAITAEQLEWIRDNYNPKAHGNGIDWTVVAYAIDDYTLMLRYVVAHKYMCKELQIEERARLVIDVANQKELMFERWCHNNPNDEWKNTRCAYFREASHYRYWNRQSWLCRDTQKYVPGFAEELRKIYGMYYLDIDHFMEINTWICAEDTVKRIAYRASLYEKLIKVGLGDVVNADYHAYKTDTINYNAKETSLLKMLGLNRRYFKEFLRTKSVKCLKMLQSIDGLTDHELRFAEEYDYDCRLINKIRECGINRDKVMAYIECHREHLGFADDWFGYVDNLKKLDYPLTDYYLFPDDFYVADLRVAHELNTKIDASRNTKIKLIAEAMRNDDKLKEFFEGSNGLMVVVPESAEDLRLEGRRLHNCLGTYVDRVADGKTLIFFVRKVDDPAAPYVAMEYCDGRIIQRRFDHNMDVNDNVVIKFTDRLAAKLSAAA